MLIQDKTIQETREKIITDGLCSSGMKRIK